MVLDGVRPEMVRMTWGRSLQLVSCMERSASIGTFQSWFRVLARIVRFSSVLVTFLLLWCFVESSRRILRLRMWAPRSVKDLQPKRLTGLAVALGKSTVKRPPTRKPKSPSIWKKCQSCTSCSFSNRRLTINNHCQPPNPQPPLMCRLNQTSVLGKSKKRTWRAS